MSPGLLDEWNRRAVEVVLEDAERTLALVNMEDLRRNPEIVPNIVARARQSCADLERRGRPLMMTDDERITFLSTLEQIKAVLRLFGESV